MIKHTRAAGKTVRTRPSCSSMNLGALMIYIFDGPEKAGKTTLIKNLKKSIECQTPERKVHVVKWGKISPDDRVYSNPINQALIQMTEDKNVDFIWDRSWASEAVYGYALGRDRRLSDNWRLGEFLHSRPVSTNGLLFMVLPVHKQSLVDRRDETDLPIDPHVEFNYFKTYAETFHWKILRNNYDIHSTNRNIRVIQNLTKKFNKKNKNLSFLNHGYFGKQDAKIVVDCSETEPWIPGAWGPGSDEKGFEIYKSLFPASIDFGWNY